jgi:hypothetical protein
MTAVNPSTAKVGVGANAAIAFQNLGNSVTTTASTNVTVTRQALVKQITSLIASRGYNLVNATSVNPTVWVNVGTVSLSGVGANETVAQVTDLLNNYGVGSVGMNVYAWVDSSGNLNFGVLKVLTQGVTQLYYVTIKP